MNEAAVSRPGAAGALAVPSFRHNALWTLLGNSGYTLCQWAFLMVIAKLGDPSAVGRFALALAVSVPVYSLSNLQLRAVQAIDSARRHSDGDYLGLRLALSLAGMLFILSAGLRTPGSAPTIVLVGLAKGFEAVSDMLYGQWQREERMRDIACSQLLKAAASLALLALGMWLDGVRGAAAGFALGMLATLVAWDWPLARRLHLRTTGWPLRARFGLPWLLRLFRRALPLGLVSLLLSLNSNTLVYMISHHRSARELGLYAAVFFCFTFGDILVSAIGTPAGPRLARFFAAGDYAGYRRFLVNMCAAGAGIGLAAACALMAVGDRLLSAAYTPEYAGHPALLGCLALNAAFTYVAGYLGCSMTSAGMFRQQVPIFAAVLLVGAGLGWFLIPAFGLIGAALSLLASTLVWFAGALYFNRIILRELRRRQTV